AFPRDAADVAAAIAAAARFEVPVVTRGAGTSLAGQTTGQGIVLDTSRHMDAIRDLDPETLRVRVGPGVVQEDLNRAAHRHGLGFGPDTSTSNRATIGGMIGNNSSGSHSIVYGSTIEHVHELEVVLSDGSRARFEAVDERERERRARAPTLEGALYRELPDIVREHGDAIAGDYPRHWRQSGGYRLDRLAGGAPFDLARFVTGSEGTLVAITEATVGLVPLPKVKMFTVGHFDSVAGAIAATEDALALDAAAIELLDRKILDLSRRKLEYRRLSETLEGDPEALLFVTVFADEEGEARERLDRLEAAWRKHGHGYHALRAESPAEQEALTKVRKSALGLLMAASSGARRPAAFVEDTAVAPERLNDYVERFREVLDRASLEAGFYGHCSVGCLHIRPFVDLTQPNQVETMEAVAEEVMELVTEFGGVNSSEHGDGLARSGFNRRVFGDDLYEAFRKVKALFDPHGRLNPGVMVDAPAMTENLRDPALPAPAPLATRLSFTEYGGMRAAADRCQRIGACRKTGIGVMCPSYMATREEEHATRGRANALVKALSSPDPRAAMGDRRLHEILDLCLECKACKSECPLSVDMASLKSEFLSHYQDIHGVPLRSRLFGAIRRLNRIGAELAPLSNLPARLAPARALLERSAGISRRRPLPRFTREHLVRWDRRRSPGGGRRGEVVFLADSFTTYTEPAVGRAATELLEAAGWRVRLESAGCCGRASISKGLLDQARDMAAAMVERLAPEAERGVPIVGCEPSCLLTLREEHLRLLEGDPRAEAVAGQAKLAEELLAEAIDDGALSLDPASQVSGRPIVFHGHCHQKALASTAASVALLEAIPGAEVSELDAGCCGMAGSFGFEAEHYELSMQVGESRLFPALRALDTGALVAATGVSCRQQIAHGTGLHARHPVELVRAALNDNQEE
ncbi:MAG TPA: FAD-linked oxidase C-terminal domain-containing protein, partial [Thermoleophilaceae bacterium]|nr:FAD-linked oxidase C-terminal domain-containing protein [Thermoleophilaceae bacterium]